MASQPLVAPLRTTRARAPGAPQRQPASRAQHPALGAPVKGRYVRHVGRAASLRRGPCWRRPRSHHGDRGRVDGSVEVEDEPSRHEDRVARRGGSGPHRDRTEIRRELDLGARVADPAAPGEAHLGRRDALRVPGLGVGPVRGKRPPGLSGGPNAAERTGSIPDRDVERVPAAERDRDARAQGRLRRGDGRGAADAASSDGQDEERQERDRACPPARIADGTRGASGPRRSPASADRPRVPARLACPRRERFPRLAVAAIPVRGTADRNG
jgi:hypothetical protein